MLAKAFKEKIDLLHKFALFDSLTDLPNRKNVMNICASDLSEKLE